MNIDVRVRTAAITIWDNNGTLTPLIPVARVYAGKLPAGPTMPYAQITSEESRPDEIESRFTASQPFIAWRKMTVTVWDDDDEDLETIGSVIVGTYILDSSWDGLIDGAAVKAIVPISGGIVEEESRSRESKTVWKSTSVFELMLSISGISS